MNLPQDFERRIIVSTFCFILFECFTAMLIGLWFDKIDNKMIFPIVDNDLKLILVAAAGFLGGRASMKDEKAA